MNKHILKGFTLIEMMIVVVIVAILATVALPAYQEQVRKSKRAEGKALLLQIQQQQERWKTENGTYTTDITDLGYPAAGADSEHGYYNAVIDTASASCPINTCVQITGRALGANKLHGSLQLRSDGFKRWKKDDATWQDGWLGT